jgi:fibrillarin-like pre-rRNA processing protein
VERTRWPDVWRDGRELYTRNADPGVKVYGETLRTVDGVEYRQWDPWRSKLAALLLNGAPADVLAPPRATLYLGGAHGTTASHLADLWPRAEIYAVEKSPSSFARLLALARRRTNLLPILADAQLPERYRADVGEVDLLYQDVAQRDQARIFVENAESCLADRGRGLLMLKVRSVTQRRPVAAVVRESRSALERAGFAIEAEGALAPFAREHVALAMRRSPSSTDRRSP